jgi:hypothetical protein
LTAPFAGMAKLVALVISRASTAAVTEIVFTMKLLLKKKSHNRLFT